MKKIVIIGGVAGGASAAARLRRLSEDTEIVILEKGQFVSFANCGLPYYLSREIASIDDLLLNTPQALSQRFNLKIKVKNEVLKIQALEKKLEVKDLETNTIYYENYDELIISTGAYPFKPPIQGLDSPGVFTVRSIEDIQDIDEWVLKKKALRACVAGGGFIGIEVAEQLKKRGLEVTIIEAMDQVLAPFDRDVANFLHQEIEKHHINLILNDALKQIKSDSSEEGLKCMTQKGKIVTCDLVILGIGVKPENQLAKEASIELGETGGIKVNDYLQTSTPNIWAIGDCIEVKDPLSQQATLIALGGPANKQGRIVADNIMGAKKKYKGTWGAFIIRVFSLTGAATGLNEKMLQKKGIKDYEVIYLHPNSHASYYPGAERLSMKVIFSKTTKKILGAQIIGGEGTDKRIDVLSTAMQAGIEIDELAYLELAYSPQYGSAKDPINLLGMIAENILENKFKQAQWAEIEKSHNILIDVRNQKELSQGSLPNSLHIPLNELREKIKDLDINKEYIVFCQSGQRSYNATRLLMNRGFKARNLSGAYLTWKAATKKY